MQTLTYTQPHDLNQLHDELLAAIPALRPILGADGEYYAVMLVTGDGDTITLNVPDDADTNAIAGVVAAHDPAKRQREAAAAAVAAEMARLAAEQAAAERTAQMQADADVVLSAQPTPEAKDALARLFVAVGIPITQ